MLYSPVSLDYIRNVLSIIIRSVCRNHVSSAKPGTLLYTVYLTTYTTIIRILQQLQLEINQLRGKDRNNTST